MGDAIEPQNHALSRRNAIKAAAAVGVGAAAWTGPKVGIFGASPAYADVCSTGEEACTAANQVSMQPNCGGNGQSANYSYANLFGPGSNTLTLDGSSFTITEQGTCTDGGSTVTVTGPMTVTCNLTLSFTKQGGGGGTITELETGVGSPAVITVPAISRGDVGAGSGSVFITAQLCCTTDPDSCGSPSVPGPT